MRKKEQRKFQGLVNELSDPHQMGAMDKWGRKFMGPKPKCVEEGHTWRTDDGIITCVKCGLIHAAANADEQKRLAEKAEEAERMSLRKQLEEAQRER